ncbi:MAG: uncharacterized protein A8A55_2868 [Amphiamblys sp. WSBS2006]|nr:MAG: uncharacterized protein A8A55_2868 [Amphiamblys sp. WSBS2006]
MNFFTALKTRFLRNLYSQTASAPYTQTSFYSRRHWYNSGNSGSQASRWPAEDSPGKRGVAIAVRAVCLSRKSEYKGHTSASEKSRASSGSLLSGVFTFRATSRPLQWRTWGGPSGSLSLGKVKSFSEEIGTWIEPLYQRRSRNGAWMQK